MPDSLGKQALKKMEFSSFKKAVEGYAQWHLLLRQHRTQADSGYMSCRYTFDFLKPPKTDDAYQQVLACFLLRSNPVWHI